ncbi:MAG: hypothetical protein ACRDUX_28990 [Mycobacterium sp.]
MTTTSTPAECGHETDCSMPPLTCSAVPDSELLPQIRQAAAVVAAHDPRAIAATKRLMTSGRAAAAQLAIERELDEMRILHPIP